VTCGRGRRGPLVMLFVVYLVLLAWLVLWKLDVPYIGGVSSLPIKLVPFLPSAGAGGSEPLEVIANVVFFTPFGVYVGLLAPRWPWWTTLGAVAVASLALEGAQYALAVGIPDATDIVTNTAGGLVGIGLLALARRGLAERTAEDMTRVCAIGTVLAVIAVGVFVASPQHHGPPRDVGPLSTHSGPCRSPGGAG
jgi:glycopeptide antibiotics resistance protein